MPVSPADAVLAAQLARFQARPLPGRTPLVASLGGARSPEELQGLVASAWHRATSALDPDPNRLPALLRRQYADQLGLTTEDLAFRDLFPGLDVGVYGCSHSMGVPSVAGPTAVLEQLGELVWNGIGVWDEGTWPELMDVYRDRCARLVGGDLEHGDLVWFPNVSEALGAVLEGIDGGTLVFTSGHFTTGHYVHHQWAQNTGGRLVEVPTEPDGSVPTERLVAALTPDVRVLSISHALFESGWVQDLPTLARELRERCPGAMLLLDAYQTAGTVPIDADALGDHVLVTAGGHKQLRSSAGASFLYVPRRWLGSLSSRRTGWWGHAAPFAFEKGAVRRAEDGSRLRTGTPTLAGMAMLVGELAALASSAGGDLAAGVARARAVTRAFVQRLLDGARAHDLPVRGAFDADRRAAFVVLRVPGGVRITEEMAREGYRVDVRPVHGTDDGYVRVSGNAAALPYEADALIAAIVRHRRLR